MPLDPQKITRRREKLKLTLQKAGEQAGWGHTIAALKRWAPLESEPGDPPLSVAEDVARALNCTVDDLLKD